MALWLPRENVIATIQRNADLWKFAGVPYEDIIGMPLKEDKKKTLTVGMCADLALTNRPQDIGDYDQFLVFKYLYNLPYDVEIHSDLRKEQFVWQTVESIVHSFLYGFIKDIYWRFNDMEEEKARRKYGIEYF